MVTGPGVGARLVSGHFRGWQLALRRLLVGVFCTLAVLSLAGCAANDTNEDGLAALERKDYSEAIRIWLQLTDDGDTAAPFYLGRMCEAGLGMEQSYVRAATWYRKAAERGNPYAQGSLAVLYAYGKGVPVDYVQSYVWSSLAANGYASFAADQRQAALRNRDVVAQRMNALDLFKAQKFIEQYREGPVPNVLPD